MKINLYICISKLLEINSVELNQRNIPKIYQNKRCTSFTPKDVHLSM